MYVQTAAARTKQRKGEEDTSIRTAGGANETKGETRQSSEKEERREKNENVVPQAEMFKGARLTYGRFNYCHYIGTYCAGAQPECCAVL